MDLGMVMFTFNVHLQNSAALVDTLMRQGVTPEKLGVQCFAVLDHDIMRVWQTVFFYRQLMDELFETKRWREEKKHQVDYK